MVQFKTIEQSEHSLLLQSHLSPLDLKQIKLKLLNENPDLKKLEKDKLAQTIIKLSMQNAIKRYLQKHPQELLWEPSLKVKSEDEQGVVFTCKMDYFPQVTLPDSYQVVLEVPPIPQPNQDDVMATIEALQVRFGDKNEVNRPAQWGDALTLDVYVTCEGQIVPRSSRIKTLMFLKENESNDPFLQGLIGMEVGQKRVIELLMDENNPYTQWRNKPACFHVHLHQIVELTVPEANDHFAQILEYGQTLEEMIDRLHQDVQKQNTEHWKDFVREQIVQQFVSQIKLEIPREWIEKESFSTFLMSDYLTLKDLQIDDESLKMATKFWVHDPLLSEEFALSLKTRFILREIAKKEQIEVTDENIIQAIQVLGYEPEVVIPQMQKEGTYVPFLNNLLVTKVSRFLAKQAKMLYEGKELQLT